MYSHKHLSYNLDLLDNSIKLLESISCSFAQFPHLNALYICIYVYAYIYIYIYCLDKLGNHTLCSKRSNKLLWNSFRYIPQLQLLDLGTNIYKYIDVI